MDRPRAAGARDEELRLRLAAGDDDALGEVYDLFGGFVHGLASRVTCDAEAARDVTQEVFTELWTNPLRFDPRRGTLRSWLAMLAHRRAVDWVRKEVAHRKVDVKSAVNEYVPHSAQDVVEDEVLAAIVVVHVRKVIGLLPEPLREAIDLTYYRGNTCQGAAVALGLPEGTFKSRLRRAMTRLADELRREGLLD